MTNRYFINPTVNQKMSKHHCTATRKMMILNNIGKDNDKLDKNNTLESKSMATCQMGIMN